MTDKYIRPQIPRCTPEAVDDALNQCGPEGCHHCDQGEGSTCRACVLAAEVIAFRNPTKSAMTEEYEKISDEICGLLNGVQPSDATDLLLRLNAMLSAACGHLRNPRLAHELRTQDNRGTAHPLYIVQEEKRIYGMDPSYSDHSEWVDSEGESCGGTAAAREIIKLNAELTCHLGVIDPADHGYTRVYYTKLWMFVTAHFTEKAAQGYIDDNRHNLNLPRIYVSSQHRCHEWNAVVDCLKGT